MQCFLTEWPINNNEILFERVFQKIAPPEPSHSGRHTGVTGSFKFDENFNFLDIV